MKRSIALAAILAQLLLTSCSKSLSRRQALSMFEKTQAYRYLSKGYLPDGGLPPAFLKSLAITGIVQNQNTASAYFGMTFTLTPVAVKKMHSNSVCTYDEVLAKADCAAAWTLTRFDDGWRYDNPTFDGGLKISGRR